MSTVQVSKVNVVFFASLRDALKCDQVEVAADTVTEALSVLQQCLSEEHYALITAPAVRIALNHDLIEGDCALQSGDELAFLPPVTGG